MIKAKFQKLDIVIAMMSRFSDDDAIYQSHVQHPYVEFYH